FVFSSQETVTLNTPEFEAAFSQLDMEIFQKTLKIFKNTKSFFEQNEKKKMQESFYEIIKQKAETYIDEAKQMMENSHLAQYEQKLDYFKTSSEKDMQQLVNQQNNMLSTPDDKAASHQQHARVTG